MSRLFTMALLAVFTLVLVPQGLLADPDHAKKVLGSVASITADRLTVKGAKGVETRPRWSRRFRISHRATIASVKPSNWG